MSFPADSKSEPALPAYNTPTFPADLLEQHDEDRRKRCRRRRRFFHLTALSLVALWFFTRDSSDSFTDFTEDDLDHDHHHDHDHRHDHDRHHYPIPRGVELQECVSWEEAKGNFPHYATGNLTLDSASDLFFVSRGSLSFGYFDLEQAKDHNGGNVGVQVSAGYSHPQFLDVTKVCRITKGDSQGVGIFTPEWKHHGPCKGHRERVHQPQFTIRVALPAAKKDEVLAVESLITDLPLFKQTVAKLGETVYFDKLRMTSVNEQIGVESATGEDIVVATVNAPINGKFNTDKLLVLETVSAAITAEVTLNHKGDSKQIVSSVFKTVSGNIEATEKLEASDKNEDAKFSTYAKGVRGNVKIEVEESPLDALVIVEAETTTGNVNVEMPPAFEGKFKLETLVGKETVNTPDVEDPAGRGRKREVEVEHPRWTTVEGSVSWSDEGKEIGGTVLMKSTTGSLVLDL